MAKAVVIIKDQADRNLIATWSRNVAFGTVVTFAEKSNRTLEQNARLWAMCHEVSEQVDWYGKKLTPDEWKDVFTASLRKANVVPGIDAGSFVILGQRTSTMSKAEFSDLMELIAAFGAEHGVTFNEMETT